MVYSVHVNPFMAEGIVLHVAISQHTFFPPYIFSLNAYSALVAVLYFGKANHVHSYIGLQNSYQALKAKKNVLNVACGCHHNVFLPCTYKASSLVHTPSRAFKHGHLAASIELGTFTSFSMGGSSYKT